MSDGPGRIFVTSGNGISPPPGPGDKPPGQLAESVIRLAPQPNGTLAAKDFFSPANAPTLDAGDLDFGSGGPVGFPFGTTAYPHILVQAGKIGRIFLLNRDDLGGREQGPGSTDHDLFQSQSYGGLWGHPAVFERARRRCRRVPPGCPTTCTTWARMTTCGPSRLGTDSAGRPVLTDVANSTLHVRLQLGLAGGHLQRHRPVLGGRLGGGQLRHERDRRLPRWPSTPCRSRRKGGGVQAAGDWPRSRSGRPASSPSPPPATAWSTWAPGTATSSASGSPRGGRAAPRRGRRVSGPPRWARRPPGPVTVTAARTVTVTGARCLPP